MPYDVQRLADAAARLLEVTGIVIIVAGVLVASWSAARDALGGTSGVYTRYRRTLARAILLGPEIFVAADIIGTVAVAPTWPNVGVIVGIAPC